MSLENYEIVKELGRGGMGAVFLANDKRLKRQVAIKVLKAPPNTDPLALQNTIINFKREAVAIANLMHNNIVCVYDIGQDKDIHYIVMELIEGQPLSKILKGQGSFDLETVLKISYEICDALYYVHKNKVIHRDIKPENIIYTAKGISKLTDFGIAKFAGDENMVAQKGPGDVKGTILYISPEQLQAPDHVDGRADMYSYAVSMYELLTGVTPFQGESAREVIMKILTQEPIAPSKIKTDLLPHIDPIILKALSKEPDKRFANIEEFTEELKKIGEFRSRFSIQGLKNVNKENKDNFFYSQISIDSFEDVLEHSKKFPDSAQQRMLYEIEILFSKYAEEYKEQMGTTKASDSSYMNKNDYTDKENYQETSNYNQTIRQTQENNYSQSIRQTQELKNFNPNNYAQSIRQSGEIKNFNPNNYIQNQGFTPPPPPQTGESNSPFFESFAFIIPKLTQDGIESTKYNNRTTMVRLELNLFLSKITGTTNFKDLIKMSYASDKPYNVFNLLYDSVQKGYVYLETTNSPKEPILLGDIMLFLGMITPMQLEHGIRVKNQISKSPDAKLIGELLIEAGYLTRDKLLLALKIQHWYRRLFT